MEKPKCKCGKEMQVIEFLGYYDSFRYWDFHEDCICKNVDAWDFEVDVSWNGNVG